MLDKELIDAQKANYWKTSSQAPDAILLKAQRLIEDVGGRVIAQSKMAGNDGVAPCYLYAFEIGEQSYAITWPILPHNSKDELAAIRQACTFIFHEVKAACMRSKIIGVKRGFVQFQLLGDGTNRNVQDFFYEHDGPLLLGDGKSH